MNVQPLRRAMLLSFLLVSLLYLCDTVVWESQTPASGRSSAAFPGFLLANAQNSQNLFVQPTVATADGGTIPQSLTHSDMVVSRRLPSDGDSETKAAVELKFSVLLSGLDSGKAINASMLGTEGRQQIMTAVREACQQKELFRCDEETGRFIRSCLPGMCDMYMKDAKFLNALGKALEDVTELGFFSLATCVLETMTRTVFGIVLQNPIIVVAVGNLELDVCKMVAEGFRFTINHSTGEVTLDCTAAKLLKLQKRDLNLRVGIYPRCRGEKKDDEYRMEASGSFDMTDLNPMLPVDSKGDKVKFPDTVNARATIKFDVPMGMEDIDAPAAQSAQATVGKQAKVTLKYSMLSMQLEIKEA